MKIHGNRVYLNLPEIKEYSVTIPAETKKQLQEELLQKMDRLEVFAIGEGVKNADSVVAMASNTLDLKIGDELFVDPNGLKRGVILEIEGKRKISVSSFDIMHTW